MAGRLPEPGRVHRTHKRDQRQGGDSLTRAQAAQLFVNALSCKTGDGKDYYTTLGSESKQDTVLLAVNTETDDGSAMGAVRTSEGTYLPDAENVAPTALAAAGACWFSTTRVRSSPSSPTTALR